MTVLEVFPSWGPLSLGYLRGPLLIVASLTVVGSHIKGLLGPTSLQPQSTLEP